MNRFRDCKVLVLQSIIPQYRVPVFSGVGRLYDLTVAYTDKKSIIEGINYKTLYLKERKWLSVKWVRGLFRLCKGYDVVIFMHDMHYVNYCLLPFLPHKYKTIAYGIGIRASYTRQFDLNRKKNLLDYLLKSIIFKADGVLFYFKEVLNFWEVRGAKAEKCFETRNTVEVAPIVNKNVEKNSILFVGTLYKEKKVDVLIEAYNQSIKECKEEEIPFLKIIGGGDQFEELKKMVKEYELEGKVIFTGPVYDEEELSNHFATALICISPNQAGLSVPHSLGYGVPFLTVKDAITGGEILHIKDGENGVLLDSLENLPAVIKDVFVNKEKYKIMGQNALHYYNNSANINVMIKGFDSVIQYVLKTCTI